MRWLQPLAGTHSDPSARSQVTQCERLGDRMVPLSLRLRMLSHARTPQTSTAEVLYRLRRCEGFAVHGPDGRVGTILRAASRVSRDGTTVLQIRTGPFVRRHMEVSIGDVEQVDLRRRRVMLSSPPVENRQPGRRPHRMARGREPQSPGAGRLA
jgi:hypothetical protein